MRFTLRPEPALALALLRIVVPLLMLLAPGFREGARVAARSPATWVAPEGLGWFAAHVPISAGGAIAAQLVVAFSALCAAAGIRARLACAVLAVSGFYLFSVAQLTGYVWHDMHMLWFCALLAASPCADVLAVDASRPLFSEGTQYAVPLWSLRLLLGAIYFFPGVHKLATSGLDWVFSDNLRYQLYLKWAEHGSVPAFRIDQHPWLLELGGLFVLAFELSFVVLISFRRTRRWAVLAGLLFHGLSQWIFRIPFASLWLCYVAVLDPRPLLRALPRFRGLRAPDATQAAPEPWPLFVGSILLAGAVIQGIRGQTQSYPFSAYPTFDRIATPELPDLALVAIDADGRSRPIVHARSGNGYRTQRQWAEIWSLAGASGPVDRKRLHAYYLALRARRPPPRELDGARRIAFYRVYHSVIPEQRGRLTRAPVLLFTLNV